MPGAADSAAGAARLRHARGRTCAARHRPVL